MPECDDPKIFVTPYHYGTYEKQAQDLRRDPSPPLPPSRGGYPGGMGIAHVCTRCGATLTRARPERDPYYGLLVVRCPSCGGVEVRRRHPLRQGFRTAIRSFRSLWVLAIQIVLLTALASATLSILNDVEFKLVSQSLRLTLDRDRWELMTMAFMLVLVGVWLTVGLSHWRWWASWGAWALGLTCLQSWMILLDIGSGNLLMDIDGSRWVWRQMLLGAMMIVSIAGVPFGLAIRLALARHRRTSWRRRRRRLQARRSPT